MGQRTAALPLPTYREPRRSLPATLNRRIPMITEALTLHAPVLAAGWSMLYMLLGGGLGGAILIFIALKAIGR